MGNTFFRILYIPDGENQETCAVGFGICTDTCCPNFMFFTQYVVHRIFMDPIPIYLDSPQKN